MSSRTCGKRLDPRLWHAGLAAAAMIVLAGCASFAGIAREDAAPQATPSGATADVGALWAGDDRGGAPDLSLRRAPVETERSHFRAVLPKAEADALEPRVEARTGQPRFGVESTVEPPRLRENFPEALYVNPALITDEQGIALVPLTFADSLTTWRLRAVGNDLRGAVGSLSEGLLVAKSFAIEMQPPRVLALGDEIDLPVGVFNDSARQLRVQATLEAAPWFQARGELAQSAELAPGSAAPLSFPFKVTAPGEALPLVVQARAESAADAERRTVSVRAPGAERVESSTHVVSGRFETALEAPPSAVPGTSFVDLSVAHDRRAAIFDGMEAFAAYPAGCGEQTLSGLLADLLVLDVLDRLPRPDQDFTARVRDYVLVGYQRVLGFRNEDGGYALYPGRPSERWLTVMALEALLAIHERDLLDTAALVVQARAFLVLNAGVPDLSGGDEELSALRERTVLRRFAAGASEAGEFPAQDPYEAAWWTLLQKEIGVSETDLATARRQLRAMLRASFEAEGPFVTPPRRSISGAWGESAAFETAAVFLECLADGDDEDHAAADRLLEWLLKRRDPHGGFGNTQSTLRVLRGLAAYLREDAQGGPEVAVFVQGEELARRRFEDGDPRPWALPLPAKYAGQTLRLAVESEAPVTLTLRKRWRMEGVPEPRSSCYRLDVQPQSTKVAVGESFSWPVTVRALDAPYRADLLADLGVPASCEVDQAALDEARRSGVIDHYELSAGLVRLYLRAPEDDEPWRLDLRLTARFSGRCRAPASKLYAYYNPETVVWAAPVLMETVAAR